MRTPATRLADDPEFTSRQSRRPLQRANSRSNWSAKRPGRQPEIDVRNPRASAFALASKTLPETATLVDPGHELPRRKAAVQYSPHEIENPWARRDWHCRVCDRQDLSCRNSRYQEMVRFQAFFEIRRSGGRQESSSGEHAISGTGTAGGFRSMSRQDDGSELRAHQLKMRFTRQER